MKFILTAATAVIVLIGGVLWSQSLSRNDPTIISQDGIHWHPRLSIVVRGEEIAIPANIGIGPQYAATPTFDTGMRMTAIHTHEDMPVVHLEFPGLVREEDIALGHFFEIWGRDMRSFGENVLPSDERGSTEASRLNVRMTVNGTENTEFENYLMRDGDIIEVTFD